MPVDIAPLHREHFAQLRQVLDSVAREGRYLVFLQAPPCEETFAFYQSIVDRALPAFVALDDGQVVGWCDVLPAHGESRSHVGIIGLGLLPVFRGRGIGAQLMRAAIDQGWKNAFTRIELTVRCDNHRAKKLYERLGFVHEGTHRRAFRVGDQYFDSLSMALLRAAD
jgi:putative acetyltransferase